MQIINSKSYDSKFYSFSFIQISLKLQPIPLNECVWKVMVPKDTGIISGGYVDNPIWGCSVFESIKRLIQAMSSLAGAFWFSHVYCAGFQTTICVPRTIIKFNSYWPALITGWLVWTGLPLWSSGTKNRLSYILCKDPRFISVISPRGLVYVTIIHRVI